MTLITNQYCKILLRVNTFPKNNFVGRIKHCTFAAEIIVGDVANIRTNNMKGRTFPSSHEQKELAHYAMARKRR